MTITLPDGYNWVLLTAVAIAFEVLAVGFVATGSRRRKHFGKEFQEKYYPELKSSWMDGYPDNGYGRFADKLSLEGWIDMANGQRAHYNFVEGVATALTLLLVAGLFYPKVAFLSGVAYFIGRALYTAGYLASGTKGRFVGVLVVDVALVVLLVLSIKGIFAAGGGVSGLVKFLTH